MENRKPADLARALYAALAAGDRDQLDDAARARLHTLAQKANEGQLAPEEAREYERFIDVSDIISTLRLKAERQVGDLALAQ